MLIFSNKQNRQLTELYGLKDKVKKPKEGYGVFDKIPETVGEELKSRPMNRWERSLANKYFLLGLIVIVAFIAIFSAITFGLYYLFGYIWEYINPIILKLYEKTF